MTLVKDVSKRFQDYKPDEHIALIIWSVADVLFGAKERGIKLTKKQAEEIVDRLENRHDASIGVSWDTIDCYLDDYE